MSDIRTITSRTISGTETESPSKRARSDSEESLVTEDDREESITDDESLAPLIEKLVLRIPRPLGSQRTEVVAGHVLLKEELVLKSPVAFHPEATPNSFEWKNYVSPDPDFCHGPEIVAVNNYTKIVHENMVLPLFTVIVCSTRGPNTAEKRHRDNTGNDLRMCSITATCMIPCKRTKDPTKVKVLGMKKATKHYGFDTRQCPGILIELKCTYSVITGLNLIHMTPNKHAMRLQSMLMDYVHSNVISIFARAPPLRKIDQWRRKGDEVGGFSVVFYPEQWTYRSSTEVAGKTSYEHVTFTDVVQQDGLTNHLMESPFTCFFKTRGYALKYVFPADKRIKLAEHYISSEFRIYPHIGTDDPEMAEDPDVQIVEEKPTRFVMRFGTNY